MPAEHDTPDPAERLARALIASVALHSLLIAWPTPHVPAGRLPESARPAPLLAHLTGPARAMVPPLPKAPEPEIPLSVGPKVGDDATPLTRKARFAVEPDFSAAEAAPLLVPVRLKLRLHVASHGAVERIEVLESRQVPPDFLVAVNKGLQSATVLPGESAGKHIASSFVLVIEAEPAAVVIQSPLGRAKVTPSE